MGGCWPEVDRDRRCACHHASAWRPYPVSTGRSRCRDGALAQEASSVEARGAAPWWPSS